jgi:ornithine decarboxylase
MGAGFDCASKAEIAAVLDLGLNVDAPTRIVYANPCKAVSHLRYAASVGVRMMTFDNHDELYKIKRHHDADPQLILRILTDDSHSVCRFGAKFGASLSQVPSLLGLAKQLGASVINLAFFVDEVS